LKTIHDLKWYGFLPGELLFLTNEFIVFLVPGEDGCPAIVQVMLPFMPVKRVHNQTHLILVSALQYTLLDMDLAIKRDFGAVRGRVKLHTRAGTTQHYIASAPSPADTPLYL
jgi:hypothetical protein